MQIKKSKVIITIISACLLFFVSGIFADVQVNTSLGINPPSVNIIFTPPYSTGFYTSGNVYAELTGEGVVAPLYMLTGNGTYVFNYRRGTGSYTTGAGFSSGNTRTLLSLVDSVTRIDKIPPQYFDVINGATYTSDVTINFTDNFPGVTATLNDNPFTNGSIVSTNGIYTLIVADVAGNSTGATFTINKNISANIIYNPPYAVNFFTAGDVITTITGFNQTGITIDNNGGSFTYTFTGDSSFTFFYHDGAGGTGATTATVSWIDKIPPTFSGVYSGAYYPNNIGITFSDTNLSGATLNGNPYSSGALITGDGTYTFVVTDLAGNATGATFTIDQTPPSYSGVVPGGVYSGNVSVTFSDTNLSGATIDGNPYTSGALITGNGVHTFEVIDKAGNSSSATFTIDKIPPTYSGFVNGNTYNSDITITFTDNLTGVTATLNGNPFTYGTTITANGTYTLIITDVAGNHVSATFTINKAITASIEYSPSSGSITSGSVIATITGFNVTGITITDNSGSPTYTFTGNDSFTFTYQDGSGHTGSAIATVSWIDKTPPQYFGFTDGTTYTNNVTINFTDNFPGVTATLNGNPLTNGSIVSTNGTYTLIVTDVAGYSITATFTLNKSTPPPSGGGDPCLMRTCNNSYYDALCGPCPATETGITPPVITPPGVLPPTVPVITPEETKEFPKEELDAYKYAYALGVTTKGTVDAANLDGPLIRKQLAKMISEYAIKVVGLKPDNTKKCDFSDMNNESEEMIYYMRLSCKLGLMGLDADGTTVRPTFMPNEIVNRAQFGTVFSRLIFGMTYNLKGEELTLFDQAINALQNTAQKIANLFGITYVPNVKIDRYTKHLNALKQNNIMQVANPIMTELRGYVMMMMMRADKNGVIQAYAGEKIPSTNK